MQIADCVKVGKRWTYFFAYVDNGSSYSYETWRGQYLDDDDGVSAIN